jgi:predicted TPR repeat methyltransferase
MHPTLNSALLISPVENGYVAYDPNSDQLHHLNPLAALLVELCDGTRSVDEIRDLVAPLLPEDKPAVIDLWIDEAVKSGILQSAADSPANYRELSADDLAKLAARLWDHGKIQPAFLCQHRASELTPDDPKKLYDLAELAFNLGRREDARTAYEKYMLLKPEDAEIKHLLGVLRDEPAPPRMPDVCVVQIYHGFSSSFESRLLDDLNYCGPQRLRQAIESVMGDRQNLATLDIGCGTGLAGVQLKPRAGLLVGVDLSPEMIALARARNLYDRLEVAEITDCLGGCQERFDLIVACDCLIYFGDLRQVTEPAARLLTPDGVFAFTLERGARYPYHLADSGRYTHHPDHVREAAAAAGLTVARMDTDFLRKEYGEDVTGLYVVLQKT